MLHRTPTSEALEKAASDYIAGRGRAIYKRELYEHVAREAILRRTGDASWAAYKARTEREDNIFMGTLNQGK
jgi:hypothetical protein